MSASNNKNNDSGSTPTKVPWGTKVGYIGTGVLIGLIAYPFVRKALGQVQPKMDKFFDDLTGKAEDYAEKASDLLARAKVSLRTNGRGRAREEAAEHSHAHSDDQG